MKNNNFEDQFREAFSGYEPILPTDEIWDNIEPKLKKKKKRRFLFLWWLVGGLGLALLGLALKQWLPNKVAVANPVLKSNESKLTPIQTEIFSEEECIKVVELTTTSPTSKSKRSFEKTCLNKKNKTLPPNVSAEKIAMVIPIDGNGTQENIYSALETVDSKNSQIQDEISDNKILTEKENSKEENIAERNLKNKRTEKPVIEKEEKQQKKTKKTKKKKKKRKERIKPLRTKWKFHVQAVTGPVLPIRIMTSNRDEGFTNFRKTNENLVGGFLISSNFVAESPRGLVLSGGLEYMEFRERFRYETMDENTTISIGTVAVVENAQGEIIETISGPVSTTTTTTRRVQHTNKYRYFSFPVGIGKAWRNRKNYWRVYGGLDFNLGFSFNGKIFTESFSFNAPIRELNSRENRNFYDRFYQRKAGIGLWLSTEYRRPITNQLSLMIAPRIKLPFSSITAPDYEIKQRYVPISLQIGINYLINPPKKKKRRVKK